MNLDEKQNQIPDEFKKLAEDFSKKNTFHRVLQDHAELTEYGLIKLKKDKEIKKVVLCSGKVYFDLLEAREKIKNNRVFFIRIEQLYPFPVKTLAKDLKRFKKNAKFYWCQEEPQNMGAWNTARNYIEWTLDHIKAENRKVNYIGRQPAASPPAILPSAIIRCISREETIVIAA